MGNSCCFNEKFVSQPEKGGLLVYSDEEPFKVLEVRLQKLETSLQNIQQNLEEEKQKNFRLLHEKDELNYRLNHLQKAYEGALCQKAPSHRQTGVMKPEIELRELEKTHTLSNQRRPYVEPPQPANSFYDFVLPLNTLEDLFANPHISSLDLEKTKIYQEAAYVAIMGFSGAGKTFVAQLLAGKIDQSLRYTPTTNMSFKLWPNRPNSLQTTIIIDLPGLTVPPKNGHEDQKEDKEKKKRMLSITNSLMLMLRA